MNLEELTRLIREREIYIDEPDFYARAFTFASEQRKRAYLLDGDNFKKVISEEYNTLSLYLDASKIQESCQVRNVLRTRRLANLLIDDKGEINLKIIPHLINLVETHLFSLGPDRQFDGKRQRHLLRVFSTINTNKEIVRLLKSIDKPTSHKYAEQIIRDTLQLPPTTSITTAHTRRAVLSAWMCTLRQNVGSCFATAPAIMIHDEQPDRFLKDIGDLLNTGRLKRTFGGIEYAVPLSVSWGGGDLKKPLYVSMGESLDQHPIWSSPGLIAALQAVNLIDESLTYSKKIEVMRSLALPALKETYPNQSAILTSAEEIIEAALLNQLNISKKDVEEYKNRQELPIFGGMLIAPAQKGGGKGQLSATFLEQFSKGCNAFKGLADNALLKAWEFSLASFSETKSQFTRWNLYASLGLKPEETGGIGACIYQEVCTRLDRANRRVQELQQEYEILYTQLKTMESRARSVSSEREGQWLKAEYQSKRNEFYTFEEMRDKVHYKAEVLANLYNLLMKKYDSLFPVYFQEVYDPDMHDVSAGPFDDSPAGFRLLYKHGRANTSLWTYVRGPKEFIESLISFFNAAEIEIINEEELKIVQNEIVEITSAVVTHLRTQEFIETAFYRMAVAHQGRMIKDPLEHLDLIDKKPWAYTSGGTMETLISCYYKLETAPTEEKKWMDNPTELFVFLIDVLKKLPPSLAESFLKEETKSMLIHSPTHAFLLKPGTPIIKSAWTKGDFTYTWLRDHMIHTRKRQLEMIAMNEEQIHFLVEQLAKKVHENYRHYFHKAFGRITGEMSPKEFRNHIVQGIAKDRGLKMGKRAVLEEDEIDSLLYTALPLFPKGETQERLEALFRAIPSLNEEMRDKLMKIFEIVFERYFQQTVFDASTLQAIAKGLLCLAFEGTTSPIDYHLAVANAAQSLGYALYEPIVFADTNWVKEEFLFTVNPGTGNLELWRGDYTGRTGAPMSIWNQWLNGSQKERTWNVYTKPYQYS